MTVDAIVKEDEMLIAKVPKYLSGKKVRIIVKEEESENSSNWKAISATLSEADMLEIPRRNIDEILDDLRTFRETGEVHFQGKFC
jgi:hypothetical protein